MSGSSTDDPERFRLVDAVDGLGPTPWSDPAWRSSFVDWIDRALAENSWELDGPLGVRLRAWSIVVEVPLSGGARVWVKANPPGSRFEPQLTSALSSWAPDHVLAPIAIDAANGWQMLPDGGVTHERPVPDDPPGAHLRDPYRRYAVLQRAVSPHVDELLGMGVPDHRPKALPGVLEALLDRVPIPEVSARRAEVEDWCAELAASPMSSSVDHGDLHEHQMFHDAAGGERWRFFDWGAASVAHPFASLLNPRGYYAAHPGASDAIETAYLAQWPGDAASLRRDVDLASRLALIGWATMRDRNFPGASDPASVDAHIRVLLEGLIAD